jgi:hypothetical protein
MAKCECGCDEFRYSIDETESISFICRNCNHTLAEHIVIRKQAE